MSEQWHRSVGRRSSCKASVRVGTVAESVGRPPATDETKGSNGEAGAKRGAACMGSGLKGLRHGAPPQVQVTLVRKGPRTLSHPPARPPHRAIARPSPRLPFPATTPHPPRGRGGAGRARREGERGFPGRIPTFGAWYGILWAPGVSRLRRTQALACGARESPAASVTHGGRGGFGNVAESWLQKLDYRPAFFRSAPSLGISLRPPRAFLQGVCFRTQSRRTRPKSTCLGSLWPLRISSPPAVRAYASRCPCSFARARPRAGPRRHPRAREALA